MQVLKIVGAGALGATWVREFVKRMYALEVTCRIEIIDFDEVEDRNLASQEFYPSDLGKTKADAMAERLQGYDGIDIVSVNTRVTKDNVFEVLGGDNVIIIDAVDNIPTRLLLWQFGNAMQVPVIHMGLDPSGTGIVNYNFLQMDHFHLSPKNNADLPRILEREVDVKIPPCELTAYRGVILNTAMAGVEAVSIFMGFDPSKIFAEWASNSTGILSEWRTNNNEKVVMYELCDMAVMEGV